MTTKPLDMSEINALAMEACDMWQEHLSTLANDPNARAELTRFLEPQRRLFADWAAMMQKGASYETDQAHRKAETGKTGSEERGAPKTESGDTHGGDALRVAQLALRLAELEKRVARLEEGLSRGTRKT